MTHHSRSPFSPTTPQLLIFLLIGFTFLFLSAAAVVRTRERLHEHAYTKGDDSLHAAKLEGQNVFFLEHPDPTLPRCIRLRFLRYTEIRRLHQDPRIRRFTTSTGLTVLQLPDGYRFAQVSPLDSNTTSYAVALWLPERFFSAEGTQP